MAKTRIIVGMSGGVDSSVTALLLKEKGYEVEGLFMKNWEDDIYHCPASVDVAHAKDVCDKLNIPLHTVNFSREYWDNVFTLFLQEYAAGRTPNPDILCNKEIKFKAFLNHALSLSADYIATGHYAICQKKDNSFQLLKGLDKNKDQSYFLYTLGQTQLSKSLFPLGEHSKPDVRKLAHQAGFINHNKKDSTGICFIGERKFKTFLNQYLPAQPGNIETEDGKIIGKHDGLMFHTIGQRQGLGIGGRKNALPQPWYVIEKDLKRNALLVTQQHDHPKLMAKELICHQLHWVNGISPTHLTCHAKVRYRQTEQPCEVKLTSEGTYHVIFKAPQWAITPGQSIVFYDKAICLGGGIIQ